MPFALSTQRPKLDNFQWFAELSADPRVRAMLEAFSPEVAVARLLEAKRGDARVDSPVADLDPSTVLELMRENQSRDAFEGRFVTHLRDGALFVLKRAGVEMPPVRVGLVESLDVNACARVLSGERVVTLNFALVFHMLTWWRGLLSVYTAPSAEPYCRCYPVRAYAISLLRVAQSVAAGSFEPLERGAIVSCDCRQPWDPTLARRATTTELFILLHEMGHIHLGHLEQEATTVSDRHSDEYAADAFAVSALVSAGMALEEALLGAGAFFTLAYCLTRLPSDVPSQTHPHPRERLDRLLSDHGHSLAQLRPRPVVMVLGDLSDVLCAQLAEDFPGEMTAR